MNNKIIDYMGKTSICRGDKIFMIGSSGYSGYGLICFNLKTNKFDLLLKSLEKFEENIELIGNKIILTQGKQLFIFDTKTNKYDSIELNIETNNLESMGVNYKGLLLKKFLSLKDENDLISDDEYYSPNTTHYSVAIIDTFDNNVRYLKNLIQPNVSPMGLVTDLKTTEEENGLIRVFSFLDDKKSVCIYSIENNLASTLEGLILRCFDDNKYRLFKDNKAYEVDQVLESGNTQLIIHQGALVYRKYFLPRFYHSSSVLEENGKLIGFDKLTFMSKPKNEEFDMMLVLGSREAKITVQGASPCLEDESGFFIHRNEVKLYPNTSFYNINSKGTMTGVYSEKPVILKFNPEEYGTNNYIPEELECIYLCQDRGGACCLTEGENVLGGYLEIPNVQQEDKKTQGVLWIQQNDKKYKIFEPKNISIIQGISKDGEAVVGLTDQGQPCVGKLDGEKYIFETLSTKYSVPENVLNIAMFNKPSIYISADGKKIVLYYGLALAAWNLNMQSKWVQVYDESQLQKELPDGGSFRSTVGFDLKNRLLINYCVNDINYVTKISIASIN